MKKLLFVLAFTFIGQQVFSQMYIVTYTICASNHPAATACAVAGGAYTNVLTTIDPSGTATYTCISNTDINQDPSGLIELNTEFNNITSQGYKLIQTHVGSYDNTNGSIFQDGQTTRLTNQIMWIFGTPWSASGLEEVATTLKSFIISPNPANDFVDISLDYSLKGESEVIFISEAGYISHKRGIGNISKNEKYNIDISKITAGKYLVTIVNGKTYTTPQKLIVI